MEINTKHTQGPFTMDLTDKAHEKYPKLVPIMDKDNRLIALVNIDESIGLDEAAANAELFRIAPEMAKLLIDLMSEVDPKIKDFTYPQELKGVVATKGSPKDDTILKAIELINELNGK